MWERVKNFLSMLNKNNLVANGRKWRNKKKFPIFKNIELINLSAVDEISLFSILSGIKPTYRG